MNRRVPIFFTVCLLTSTPFSESPPQRVSFAQGVDATRQEDDAITQNKLILYADRQARWLVDLRLGAVSVWDVERDVPLWSRDGVVFRVARRPNDALSDLRAAARQKPLPTLTIFGRVYFFLNDVLIALDPRAQGRLVWRLNADDFAAFFDAPNNESPLLRADDVSLSFVPNIRPAPNDRLLIQTRRGQDTKFFLIDAASGEFRLVHPDETL